MSDLTIVPYEQGVFRLLALDMRPDEAKFLREPGAVGQVPGVEGLDSEQTDIFPVSDLEDLGVCDHPNEGCVVSEARLSRSVLEAVHGRVMVLRRAVFGGRAARLSPDPRLRLIGAFTEETANRVGGTSETENDKPFSTRQDTEEDGKPFRAGSFLNALQVFVAVGGALWLIL